MNLRRPDWTIDIRQAFLVPTYHCFPSTSVPGDGLVLDVASTHYYVEHSVASTTIGRSVDLITINISDRWRKRERGATLTSSDKMEQKIKTFLCTTLKLILYCGMVRLHYYHIFLLRYCTVLYYTLLNDVPQPNEGLPAWRLMQLYSITVGFSPTFYC